MDKAKNTMFAKLKSTRKKNKKNKLHHKKEYKKLNKKNLSVFLLYHPSTKVEKDREKMVLPTTM